MKFFKFIIEGLFYLGMLLAPTLGLGVLGGILYLWQRMENPNAAIALWIISGALGLVWGVLFAEKYRKKMPPSMFWAQLIATPQLDYDANEKTKSRHGKRENQK